MKKILVTGIAGFIGFHMAKKLAPNGFTVVGIDNINNYYSQDLKLDRLESLGFNKKEVAEGNEIISSKYPQLSFIKMDISDSKAVLHLFKSQGFDFVLHFAAQAGVRYSLENPHSYINSNITGFLNILEGCRFNKIEHLIFASSSSVYGGNIKMPFSVQDSVSHPVSLYAATKKSNELMAHTYSHLFEIPVTGLRFFTVYGPWGRPDMAYFHFLKCIFEKKAIPLFNKGKMKRDFTFIDDVIESIMCLVDQKPASNMNFDKLNPENGVSWAPFRILNIGNSDPVLITEIIRELENNAGIKAIIEYLPMQPGDVENTFADTSELKRLIGKKPETNYQIGIKKFVEWYINYFEKK